MSEVSADGSCSQREIPGLWRSHLCDRSVTSYSWAWGLVASEHTQPLSAARGLQTETENKLLTHHSPPALCQSLPAPCHGTALPRATPQCHATRCACGLVTHPCVRSPACETDSHTQLFQKNIRKKQIGITSYRKFCVQLVKRQVSKVLPSAAPEGWDLGHARGCWGP